VFLIPFSDGIAKMNKIPFLLLAVALSARAAPEMCFNQAGRDYGIDPLLLTAISIKESRLNPAAINGSNSNGTEDVCGMQINSSHYGKLKNFNISRADLLSDPCICVYTGAWVLAKNFNGYGRNWDSVGMYNTGPSPKFIERRRAYARDIKNIYRVLLARKIIADKQAGAESQRTAATITPAPLPVEK
jgi:soluble lytic murein transglycosylase-like protein